MPHLTHDANISMTPPMITATTLCKVYDEVEAVQEVSLEVDPGQTLGLIGPNGAGKTTLLRMLATLAKPDAGSITIAGVDAVHEPRHIRRRLGFMPAEFGIPRDLNLREYMRYFACLADLRREDRDGAIDQALELTDLKGRDKVMVGGLSTGNKQRLLLAKTLIHDPELLILDEPSSGLDPRARVEVREILQELAGLGKTIVISSHILKDLESICSHVLIMEAGRVAAAGDVLSLRKELDRTERRARLHVPPDAMDAAVTALNALDHVSHCQPDRDGWLLVSSSHENCNPLLRALIDAEIEVLALADQSSDLESIFIQATKGQVT